MQSLKHFCLLGLLILSSVAVSQNSHAFLWTKAAGMQDLGTLGGSQSWANGINSSGEVVGGSYVAGDVLLHAFKWTKAAGMQDLGTLTGYDGSIALGVNTSGQVVGNAYHSASQISHAVLWSANGNIRDLGAQNGASSEANGVHDGGAVTGVAYSSNSSAYPFLWTAANLPKLDEDEG